MSAVYSLHSQIYLTTKSIMFDWKSLEWGFTNGIVLASSAVIFQNVRQQPKCNHFFNKRILIRNVHDLSFSVQAHFNQDAMIYIYLIAVISRCQEYFPYLTSARLRWEKKPRPSAHLLSVHLYTFIFLYYSWPNNVHISLLFITL